MKKKKETIKSLTSYPDKVVFEEYPVVTECPECHSENGHQSFDIWICNNCGKWPYIPPIKGD